MYQSQENCATGGNLDPSPHRARLIQILGETATLAPDQVAVRVRQRSVTYRELLARAETLAARIADAGAAPGRLIGIHLPRSPEYVVSMLAVLRSGSAILPLDPSWPAERVQRVVAGSGAAMVLRGGPGEGFPIAIEQIANCRAAANPDPPGDADLAYVIYTSGSTGEPKGVEITLANLLNLIDWHIDAFAVSRSDRVSWTAGLAFDASIWELLPALAAGATIHIPPETVRASADALCEWLVAEKVTVGYVATPLAETLITQPWPEDTPLRTLLTGGDMLHTWPRRDLPFRVVNNYGPTECTVVATSGTVNPQASGARLPSIGTPIANSRVAIIDETGQRAAPGAVGELYIAGANVGRGYRNDARLTKERFVTLTLTGEEPTRYYRTGDLAVATPDGEIVIHGRVDDQIKIRGHRIEPDEIAAVLAQHPAIAQSVVIADGDGIDKRLVAYVVLNAELPAPRATELRDLLGRALPSYMLPALFVRVASLPLTGNGKVDRTKLPAPDTENLLSGIHYRAPQSALESRIASMVESLLGISGVGIDDNFFLLGGHSLLGTQLILRLRDTFGVDLGLRDLFEAKTIQNLAAKVEHLALELVLSTGEEDLERRFCVS